MRTIRAIDLARTLGISRRTVSAWCKNDAALAYKNAKGVYYIRVSELAKRPGFDLISALTIESSKWIKAVDLACISGRSRRTISYWCLTRPRFAKRIKRCWYLDLEAMGATEEQVETLKRWTPNQKTAIRVLEAATFLRKVLE